TEALWQVEHKYDALIPECFGPARFNPKAPLNAVIILHWRKSADPMIIERIHSQDKLRYLPNITKKNDLLYLPENKNYTDPTTLDYFAALADTPIFIIRGGINFVEATSKLMKLLLTGSTGT
ncbi:MAG: hypothetical protein MI749_16920, partial [Desulfovibrionales bacterium]|nr:hypothetical protein [Desulfovibrionales bacterium]